MVIVAVCVVAAFMVHLYRPATFVEVDPTARLSSEPYRFEDVTSFHRIPSSRTPTWGAAWLDHDGDGWPELLVNRHKRRAWFFRGEPGGPRLVGQPALERPAPGRNYYDRHACSWGEATGDGAPDMYCVAGAQKGMGMGSNQLLTFRGGRFVDIADGLGLADPYGRGRTVNWLDIEGDGDLDLFVGNEIRSGRPNLMFRNDRGSFERVETGVTEEMATINSTIADWDNDGDTDILVLGHGSKGSLAYENTGGSFRSISIPSVTGRPWISAAWGDFDDDGWIDLHLMSRWRSVLFRNVRGALVKVQENRLWTGRMSAWLDVENDGDLDLFVMQGEAKGRNRRTRNREDFLLLQTGGRFSVQRVPGLRGPRDGSGDAVASADYDRDGRVDLLVTNGYLEHKGRVQLLRNASLSGGWLGLVLRGDDWNPFGIGARVEVSSGGEVVRRIQVTDGFNFKAQSEAGYLHVGVAGRTSARVRVVWPDGTADCLPVTAGRAWSVMKGLTPCGPNLTRRG